MDSDAKTVALRMIESMPDDASLEDIMYELFFRQRIDRGLEELSQGLTVSQDDVKRSLAQWLQSVGQ
jgi:predicted transcriptional regulator